MTNSQRSPRNYIKSNRILVEVFTNNSSNINAKHWWTVFSVQKDYIKQLIVECEVQRFTVEESMAYIKEKLKDKISVEHFYYMRRQIRKVSVNCIC
jgi:hypothetical protein